MIKDETALCRPGPQPGPAASPGLGFPMGTLTPWVHGRGAGWNLRVGMGIQGRGLWLGGVRKA